MFVFLLINLVFGDRIYSHDNDMPNLGLASV